MNPPEPTTNTAPEWNEARSRLEAYLQALHLANPGQRERIVQMVLPAAAGKQAQNPLASPTVLVMNEIRDRLEQWFEIILRSRERASVTGLITLAAVDGFKKWPETFLVEPVPADFQQNLLACEVRAAPDLKVSSMVPQPFDPLGDMPSTLEQLTKNLAPSFVAKTVVFVLSVFSFWGNRLR